jgi:hypothetical protein
MSIATTPSGSVHGNGEQARKGASSHSPADDMKLRQHHAHRTPESSDMLLYLAGINEHCWKQAMERSTFAEDNSVPFQIQS